MESLVANYAMLDREEVEKRVGVKVRREEMGWDRGSRWWRAKEEEEEEEQVEEEEEEEQVEGEGGGGAGGGEGGGGTSTRNHPRPLLRPPRPAKPLDTRRIKVHTVYTPTRCINPQCVGCQHQAQVEHLAGNDFAYAFACQRVTGIGNLCFIAGVGKYTPW